MITLVRKDCGGRDDQRVMSAGGGVLRLTLLAPNLVEAILGGRQLAEVTLAGLMRPFPVGWRQQSHILGA